MVMCSATLSAVSGFRRRKLAPALRVAVDSFELETQAKITTFELDFPLRTAVINPKASGTSRSTKMPSNLLRLRQSLAESTAGERLKLAPYFLIPRETAVTMA